MIFLFTACGDPEIFAEGLPGLSFLCYFTVLKRGSNGLSIVNFKEKYNFPRFQRGSNIFQYIHIVKTCPMSFQEK